MSTNGTRLALLAGASFAANNVITKLAYDAAITVPYFLAFRTSLSAILVWIVAFRRTRPLLGVKTVLVLGALGAVGYAGQSVLFGEAIKRTSASATVMGLYIFPVVVAVLAVALRRDSIGAIGLLALLFGVTGVFLALGIHHRQTELWGVCLALLSGVTYGILILFISRATALAPPLHFSAIILTGMSASLTVLALLTRGDAAPVTGEAWRWVALSSIAVALGITAFAASVSRIGPTRASIGNTVEPPATALLAGIFLGDPMPVRLFVGTGFVAVALILLRNEQARRTRSAAAPERVTGVG